MSSALDEEAEAVLYAAVAAYCATFVSLGTVGDLFILSVLRLALIRTLVSL